MAGPTRERDVRQFVKLCVWCRELHDSTLQLCPACEREATASRVAMGRPVIPSLVVKEEPDD